MGEKKSEEARPDNCTDPQPIHQSIQSKDVVLPKSLGAEAAEATHVHLDYSDDLGAPTDAISYEEPVRHVPPTPVGNTVSDTEASPPIELKNECDSVTTESPAMDAAEKRNKE